MNFDFEISRADSNYLLDLVVVSVSLLFGF